MDEINHHISTPNSAHKTFGFGESRLGQVTVGLVMSHIKLGMLGFVQKK